MSDARLRVWTCIDHATHYPVGSGSVVIAADEDQARKLLDAELVEHGLTPNAYTLKELPLDTPYAEVLCDGDY